MQVRWNLDHSFSRCSAYVEASHAQSLSSSRMFCRVTKSTSHSSVDKTDFKSECESDSYVLNDFHNLNFLCLLSWVRLNATWDLSALLITANSDRRFVVSRMYIWISLLIIKRIKTIAKVTAIKAKDKKVRKE